MNDDARANGLSFLREVQDFQLNGKTKKVTSENDAGNDYCLEKGWVTYDKRRKGVYISEKGERVLRSLAQ